MTPHWCWWDTAMVAVILVLLLAINRAWDAGDVFGVLAALGVIAIAWVVRDEHEHHAGVTP